MATQKTVKPLPYMLDGEPASAQDIIEAAKAEGYENHGGLYFTSVAAKVLRRTGHEVELNPRAELSA